MTTIPICQDLELLMAPFLNSQLTLTHQLEWDCKFPFFQEDQFNWNTLWFQSKRFKLTSSKLHLFANGNSKNLSLQTRFVQITLVSRVCITVSNYPNPSHVYIRLCKHGKRFLLLKCWAVKRALRSLFNVWCGVGLARALFPRFWCAWRPAKFSSLQTGNPIFFL